eukprot:6482354-Amphidinium_carterae.3
MNEQEFRALFVRLSEVSRTLGKDELREAFALAEVGKVFMKALVEESCRNHADSVVLLQYSCDCTPTRTRRFVSKASSRAGRKSMLSGAEYLVQLLHASVLRGDEEMVQKVAIRDPMLLSLDKKNVSLLSCAMQFLAGSFSNGSLEAVTIFVQIHDRGVSRGFRDALSGHMFQKAVSEACASEMVGARQPEMIVHLDASCALHDGHNALRWCWQGLCKDSSARVRNLYLGLTSMRFVAATCLSILPKWFTQVLKPVSESACKAETQLRELYVVLGVPADLLGLICEEARLWWDSVQGKLEVADSFLARVDSLEVLSDLLLALWQFKTFTESRWLSIGASCRAWALGVKTGFQHLYQFVRQHGELSDWETSAGENLQEEEFRFAVVMGLTSHCIENYMSILLVDNRLVQQKEELEALLLDEISYIELLSPWLWQTLAANTSASPQATRDLVLNGLHLSCSYVVTKTFRALEVLPWTLGQGDLRANLDTLLSMEVAPVDRHIRHTLVKFLVQIVPSCLYLAGMGHDKLVDVLRAISQVSFTTFTTERLHGSMAALRRHHDYTQDVLTARSFLHVTRSS